MPRKSNTPTLAFKLTDHDAWSSCQVSLPSTGPQTILNVQFPGLEGNNEVNIFTANEARARLRCWSKLLEKGQCLQMHEGDIVLASRKLETGISHFFDARIEKIDRQRHSARASCKCSFELLWLDRKMKGNVCTVPASQICQIIEGNLQEHPVIADWLKYLISEDEDQPEARHIGIHAQAQLEEESGTITTMADQNCFEEESTTQSSAETTGLQRSSQRRQRKGKLESIPEAVCVRTSTRKRSQSSRTEVLEDKTQPEPSFPFGKRPHLSPPAGNTSVPVAPPGCPSSATSPILQVKMLEPQPQKNPISARSRPSSRVARYDQDEIETSEAQKQGKTGSRRRSVTIRGRSRRTPESKALSTIQECSVESEEGFPSENQNLDSIVAPPNDILDDNPLRDITNYILKEGKPKCIGKRDDATQQLKRKVQGAGNSKPANEESWKEMHLPADEATKHEALQGKAEALETESQISLPTKPSGVKRGRKPTRSKTNLQSTTIVEKQKDGATKPGVKIDCVEETSIQDERGQENKHDRKKRQPVRKGHGTNKRKSEEQEPLCLDSSSLADNEQICVKEAETMPGEMMDLTLEWHVEKNCRLEGLKFRIRRVSFDALPVGFGLGITGCPRSPLPSPEANPERTDLIYLPIEPSDVNHAIVLSQPSPDSRSGFQIQTSAVSHAIEHNRHESSTAVETKAIIEDRNARWDEEASKQRLPARKQRLPAAHRTIKEEEPLGLNQGKKVMLVSKASSCARAEVKAFSSSADIEKLSEEAVPTSKEHFVSSPRGYFEQDANVETSTKTIVASVCLERTQQQCQNGASSMIISEAKGTGKRIKSVSLQKNGGGLEEENVASMIISEVKRRSGKRTRSVVLKPMQEGLQTINTYHQTPCHDLENKTQQQCISEVKRQSGKRSRSSASSSSMVVPPPMHTTLHLTPHDKQEEGRRSSRLRSANNKKSNK